MGSFSDVMEWISDVLIVVAEWNVADVPNGMCGVVSRLYVAGSIWHF